MFIVIVNVNCETSYKRFDPAKFNCMHESASVFATFLFDRLVSFVKLNGYKLSAPWIENLMEDACMH